MTRDANSDEVQQGDHGMVQFLLQGYVSARESLPYLACEWEERTGMAENFEAALQGRFLDDPPVVTAKVKWVIDGEDVRFDRFYSAEDVERTTRTEGTQKVARYASKVIIQNELLEIAYFPNEYFHVGLKGQLSAPYYTLLNMGMKYDLDKRAKWVLADKGGDLNYLGEKTIDDRDLGRGRWVPSQIRVAASINTSRVRAREIIATKVDAEHRPSKDSFDLKVRPGSHGFNYMVPGQALIAKDGTVGLASFNSDGTLTESQNSLTLAGSSPTVSQSLSAPPASAQHTAVVGRSSKWSSLKLVGLSVLLIAMIASYAYLKKRGKYT